VHESSSFAGISANGLLNAHPIVHKWSPHLHFETQPCKLAQYGLAKQLSTCFAHLFLVHWQVGAQATVAQSRTTGAASTFMTGYVSFSTASISMPDQHLLFVHERSAFAGNNAKGLLNAQPIVHKWSPQLHFETQPCKLAQWGLAKQSSTCFAHLLSVHWQVALQATVPQSGDTGDVSTLVMG